MTFCVRSTGVFGKFIRPKDMEKMSAFFSSKGQIFRPFAFPGDNALAIEYAETPDDAEKNLFEDGDRFYLSELSISELFKAMVAEVEG